MKSAFVYILTNKRNGTLYIGVTDDLPNRIHQHKIGRGSEFTSKYKLDQLVWFAEFPDKQQARAQEHRMKTWQRKWKIEEIEKFNPTWKDLSLSFNQ